MTAVGVQKVESGRSQKLPCEILLRISARLRVPKQEPLNVKVLVDTGAEVCLVRRGLVRSEDLAPAKKPRTLVAANGQRLPGGDLELQAELQFDAIEWDTKKSISLTAPTSFYEAETAEDIIVSYRWLAER